MALPSLVYRSSACTPAMTTRLSAMMISCTVVRIRPPTWKVRPWLIVYETPVPPATASTPNSMISVIPSDTMTRVIGDVPRRWNGAYTPEFTSTDPREHAATAATRPSHTEAPAWFTTYAMNAPAIMIAPYARLSTSVTPNCSVKPTAAMARTDAVTSPNPTEARKSATTPPRRPWCCSPR